MVAISKDSHQSTVGLVLVTCEMHWRVMNFIKGGMSFDDLLRCEMKIENRHTLLHWD